MIVFALVPILGVQQHVFAQNTGPSAVLKIGGNVATPFEISAADLKKMTRKTLSLVNPHNKKTEVYEGLSWFGNSDSGKKLRLAVYGLCEACAALPDTIQIIHRKLFASRTPK